MLIVHEFFDVFSEDLLGLPPDRELEFGIELLLSSTLISISTYRMADKVFTEITIKNKYHLPRIDDTFDQL